MSVSDRLKEAAVAAAVSNPVPALIAVVLFVVFAIWLVAKLIPYMLTFAAIVILGAAGYYILSSGLLGRLIEDMRSHRERYLYLGIGLMVIGIAVPFTMQPMIYANLRINYSFDMKPAKGLFGFVVQEIDLNSVEYNVLSTGASSGVPVFHLLKASPDYKTEPGDNGYWLCFHSDDESSPTLCWSIQGVDILGALVGGSHRDLSFVVHGYPITKPRGYFILDLYRDGYLVRRDVVPYLLLKGTVELNVSPA